MSDLNRQQDSTVRADGADFAATTREATRDLAHHAEALLEGTSTMTHDGIAALRTRLDDSLKATKAQIDHAQQYALEKGREAASATDTYVHERPWQAIAAAATLGLAIGFFLRRSRR